MSKHWRPDEEIVRPRFGVGKRLRSLDEFVPPDFAGRMQRSRRPRLSDGSRAGLALVAAACLGLAIGMYRAFGPLVLFAPGSDAEWSAGPAATVIPGIATGAWSMPTDGRIPGRSSGRARESEEQQVVGPRREASFGQGDGQVPSGR